MSNIQIAYYHIANKNTLITKSSMYMLNMPILYVVKRLNGKISFL